MLLALKPPACANDLDVVTRHVLALLEHVAEHEGKTLETLLEDLDWLSDLVRHDATREAVKQFLKQPQTVRLAIAKSVKADIEIDPDDPDFDFAWPKLPGDVGKHVKTLFVKLYEDAFCGGGFTDLPGQAEGKLSSSTFEAAFRASNPATPICPACLGELPSRIQDRSAVDREHYFPKSAYPPLALHPLNLVLTCVTCNRQAHGNVDPIALHGAGAIDGVYLPYVRAGAVDLKIDFDYPSAMVKIGGLDPKSSGRMARLNLIYRLDEQWANRLQEHVHNAIMGDVVGRVGPDGSPSAVLAELRTQATIRWAERFSLPHALLTFHYLRWLMENLDVVVGDLRDRRVGDSVEMT